MANSNEYMNDYMKRRWKRRRANAIRYLGGCCVECGSTTRLEFDHIDPKTKVFTIASASSVSRVRFVAEVKKCQLLCRPHHEAKSRSEGHMCGEKNGNALFTDKEVAVLRRLYRDKRVTIERICERFCAHKLTVSQMLSGKTYRHII